MSAIQLKRYFTITNLVGVGLAALLLMMFHRHIAHTSLLEHEERANVAMAGVLANSLWPRWSAYVVGAPSIPRAELAARTEVALLRADILRELHGMPLLKVNIYHPSGLVVFSTVPEQIGEDKSGNSGFRQALAGTPASAVVFRDAFLAFEGMVTDRNLVTSYVPVRSPANGAVEAVLELYSDVTPLVVKLDAMEKRIITGTFTVLFGLYIVLMLAARRAERMLRRHEAGRDAEHATIRHRAYHDVLTELPNRASFNEQLDAAVRRARRGQRPLALMFVDIDGFKPINDRLGHAAGDELLRVVGTRLRQCVRESDTVFRVGGDEFTILLDDAQNAEDPVVVVRRIREAMTTPIALCGEKLVLTVSIGIALSAPLGHAGLDTMLQDADTAMYSAKQAGRDRFAFFLPEMRPRPGHLLLDPVP